MSSHGERQGLLCDDPRMPDDLRQAFAAYASVEPSLEAREALLGRVLAGGGGDDGPGGGADTMRAPDPSSAPPGASGATPQRERRGGPLRRVGIAGLVLIGLCWLGWSRPTVPRVAGPEPVRDSDAQSVRGATSPASPARAVASVATVQVGSEPTVEPQQVASEPAPRDQPVRIAETRVARPGRRVRAAPPGPPVEALDAEAELALLTRAKRALATDPALALSLTEQHLARYPRGVFHEEREVIAIEALSRRGELAAAGARATRFRSEHPRSPHLDRLRVILREP